MRNVAEPIIGSDHFEEIYLQCDISVCEQRDPKGLYELQANDKIKNFSGKDSPFEESTEPTRCIQTDKMTTEACIKTLVNWVTHPNA